MRAVAEVRWCGFTGPEVCRTSKPHPWWDFAMCCHWHLTLVSPGLLEPRQIQKKTEMKKKERKMSDVQIIWYSELAEILRLHFQGLWGEQDPAH